MKKYEKPKVSEFLFFIATFIILIALALWSAVNIIVCLWYHQQYNWWPLISLGLLLAFMLLKYLLDVRKMVNKITFQDRIKNE